MPAVDPFVSLRDWRASLYCGDATAIDQFLDVIDALLPPGWVRAREYERARLHPDLVRHYLFDGAGDAAVRVWLQRVAPTRVRGGQVQLLRHAPAAGAERVGQLVADFADACVLPAAKMAGVRCTRPAFGPRSAVTSGAEMQFTRLADMADGKWPLPDAAQAPWDDLIASCLAEHVAVNRAELENWLADSGWEQAAVTPIAERFFADSERLAKRLAVTAP
ncbi:MAG TPA: hypothetical protein VIK18_16365 [Pirellulales bacterium]